MSIKPINAIILSIHIIGNPAIIAEPINIELITNSTNIINNILIPPFYYMRCNF